MSASDTSISSKPKCRITDDDHDHAADDHVDPARFEPGVVAALRDRLGRERAEHLLGRGARQPEVVDALALGRVDAELDRGHRPHRARGPDQRLRVARRRAPRGRRRRGGRARPTRPGSAPRRVGGSECRYCSVSRTQPMSTEISPSGSSVPTMNSVEPPPTSTTRYGSGSVEAGGRAEELERAPLPRPQSSSGRTPSSCLGRVEELVAVRRVARRARRGHAHALDAESRRSRSRYSREHRDACARSRRDASRRARVDALTEPGDPRAPVDVASGASRRRRRRRRRAGASSWCRCRPPRRASCVRRRPRAARRDPTPDRIVAAREMNRRSARAGTSRRARVPPTPPRGRGPS